MKPKEARGLAHQFALGSAYVLIKEVQRCVANLFER
jgi:hypothetical protein